MIFDAIGQFIGLATTTVFAGAVAVVALLRCAGLLE